MEPSEKDQPRWPRWLTGLYLAFFVTLVGVGIQLNIAADRVAQPSLAFLRPAIQRLTTLEPWLRPFYLPTSAILPATGVLLVLYVLFAKVRWLAPRQSTRHHPSRWAAWILSAEVASLVFVTLAIFVYRFYALNHLPRNFVGELVFMVVCASDWPSLLAINGEVATRAPWAPLGLLYFLLMRFFWQISGATILTMRFAAAVSSMVLVPVLYWLARSLGGPLAALLAVSFYMVTPVEMAWGRHDMQPFSYPSLPVILLCATTYLAITRFKVGYWLVTALLMGVVHHSFASGYSAFLIPIAVICWLALFDRQRLARCRWKPLLLVLGLGLWVSGPSLSAWLGDGRWRWISPAGERLSSRAFRGTGWSFSSLEPIVENLRRQLERLYLGLPGDVHQTPMAYFGAPDTYVAPLVTILFSVGLVWLIVNRRDPASGVMLSFLGAGMVPGLISIAEAHRQAAMYPAICTIAGVATAAGLHRFQARFHLLGRIAMIVLPLSVLPVMFARAGAIYLSRPIGEPPSETITREIMKQVEPGTLLVLDLPYALATDVAYLLFDVSLSGSMAWNAQSYEQVGVGQPDWPTVVENPQPSYDHLFYRYTALRNRVPELKKQRWNRVVYVIHHSLDPAEKLRLLRAKYPNVEVTEVRPDTWRGSAADAFAVATVLRE